MKKQLVLFLALALCLGLTACGDTESDDTQSGYETVMDMEFLDGMWSIDGTAKLYFDSTEGFYAYRTRWGLGGRGEFELSEASGRPMIFFNGLLYNFLLRDDGVLLPNRNGEGSGLTIHRNTFLRDDEAEIVEWDKSNWDGMWQNALGETIVINSSLMQYIACSPDYSMSGTMDDEGEGMGLYLYDNGTRAYLCPGDDGNSFTLSAERFGRHGDDQHFDGVFYRNADFYAYTDMENAEFYEDEYSTFYIWYYDGIQQIGVARASVFIALNPLSAVLFGAALLGEQMTLATLFGGVLIISGIVVENRQSAAATLPEQPAQSRG